MVVVVTFFSFLFFHHRLGYLRSGSARRISIQTATIPKSSSHSLSVLIAMQAPQKKDIHMTGTSSAKTGSTISRIQKNSLPGNDLITSAEHSNMPKKTTIIFSRSIIKSLHIRKLMTNVCCEEYYHNPLILSRFPV